MIREFKIGVVGCGAIVQSYHLPILKNLRGVKIHALVDKNLATLEKLKLRYKVPVITDDYHQINNKVNVVLIALPNFLHYPISSFFLRNKVNVFCEKPMAINYKEAYKMIRIAKSKKVKLGVGMVRRFQQTIIQLKKIIKEKKFGRIKSFDYEEGTMFDWPVQSLYIFKKRQAGGGVLFDTGSHVLDLIINIFGQPNSFKYEDDAYGGTEANCRLNLQIKNIKGRIELSRNRVLRNTFIVNFTNGRIELPTSEESYLSISKETKNEIIKFKESFRDLIKKELTSYINFINDNSEYIVNNEEVAESIKLINECYKYKKKLDEPWFNN